MVKDKETIKFDENYKSVGAVSAVGHGMSRTDYDAADS